MPDPTAALPRRLWDRSWSWSGPLSLAAVAFAMRIWHIGRPHTLLFDETYYAKDAWSLLKFGYVRGYKDHVDAQVANGSLTDVFSGHPAEIVHPEVGKAMIGFGEWTFGMNALGWRVVAALVGALSVLVLARLVRRLTHSTAIGCFAGALLALDGLHFVMSRLALLDGFLEFWLLCAVACLVVDRDWLVARLARDGRWRRLRPWQLAAGVCFGLAMGTKWSAAPVLAAFGLAAVGWELYERRNAEQADPIRSRPPPAALIVQTAVPAFGSLVVVAAAVYLATWTGWLVHWRLYAEYFGDKHWYVGAPSHGLAAIPDAVQALWQYHRMVWNFHTGAYLAAQHHPYQSQAWSWLILYKPVAVDLVSNIPAAQCHAAATTWCLRTIVLLGNPVVWWTGAVATLAGIGSWIATKDWRWSVPIFGVAATWLPWLPVNDRPIFQFYAVATLPFLIIATSLAVCLLFEQQKSRRGRRWVVAGAVALVALAAVAFCYWYPIYTDGLISYDSWRDHMRIHGWH